MTEEQHRMMAAAETKVSGLRKHEARAASIRGCANDLFVETWVKLVVDARRAERNGSYPDPASLARDCLRAATQFENVIEEEEEVRLKEATKKLEEANRKNVDEASVVRK